MNIRKAAKIEHVKEMLDKIENGTVAGEKAHRWLMIK